VYLEHLPLADEEVDARLHLARFEFVPASVHLGDDAPSILTPHFERVALAVDVSY
jgi:hypothetical protein